MRVFSCVWKSAAHRENSGPCFVELKYTWVLVTVHIQWPSIRSTIPGVYSGKSRSNKNLVLTYSIIFGAVEKLFFHQFYWIHIIMPRLAFLDEMFLKIVISRVIEPLSCAFPIDSLSLESAVIGEGKKVSKRGMLSLCQWRAKLYTIQSLAQFSYTIFRGFKNGRIDDVWIPSLKLKIVLALQCVIRSTYGDFRVAANNWSHVANADAEGRASVPIKQINIVFCFFILCIRRCFIKCVYM